MLRLHVLAPHRLHDHFLGLHLFEFADRVVLRLQRLDKGIAVAAEILPDDFVHPFFNVMIGNLIALLFERLDNQLPIDQVLAGPLRRGSLILVSKLFAGGLRTQQLFSRRRPTRALVSR